MSTRPSADNGRRPVTIPGLFELKRSGRPIVMVTAYDYPSARAAEAADVDMVLVGDSGAMTVLGHPSTVAVTVDEMLVLAKAARRGVETPCWSRICRSGPTRSATSRRSPPRSGSSRRPAPTPSSWNAATPLDQPGAGHRRRRGAGGRPRRPHPAVGDLTRRLPRAGPHRRIGAADRQRRAGSAGRRVLQHRLRGRAQRADRGLDAADDASRSSASAPARPPTARSWCSTTCSASGTARARSSSAGTPICRTP